MCKQHKIVEVCDEVGVVMECQDCGVAVAEFEWIGGQLVDTRYLAHPKQEVDDESE
jgi:hypothetical protein